MKGVFFLIPSLGSGGAERVACRISEYMGVPIIALDGANPQLFPKNEVIDLKLPAKRSIFGKLLQQRRRTRALVELMRQRQATVVIAFMEAASIPLLVAAGHVGRSVKTVVSIRSAPGLLNFVNHMQIRRHFPSAHRIVFQTESALRIISEESNLPLDKCCVIANPLGAEFLAPINSWECRDGHRLIAIGRLCKQKGFDKLISAFSLLGNRNYQLNIYGEGPERGALQLLINNLGMNKYIRLVGDGENILSELNKARLFVLSSPSEGFPNAMAESMARGCPIVSFNCPTGPGEMIEDGKSGILVENGNVNELANAMRIMLGDDVLSRNCAGFARRRAESWSIDRIAKQWLD